MRNCKRCGVILTGSQRVYCSNKCQGTGVREKVVANWLAGNDRGYSGKTYGLKQAVRAYLLEEAGFACQECGWDKRHPVDGLPLVEVDHVDGDASNCSKENLRVLCPNCHSMTPTFRARNKSSIRRR